MLKETRATSILFRRAVESCPIKQKVHFTALFASYLTIINRKEQVVKQDYSDKYLDVISSLSCGHYSFPSAQRFGF
jgi:phenylalanine-4-hydroxylase